MGILKNPEKQGLQIKEILRGYYYYYYAAHLCKIRFSLKQQNKQPNDLFHKFQQRTLKH